jgi:DNA adenine methylase
VNVFRVLQDRANFEELRHRLMYTPYARSEFIRALAVDENASPLERAWATLVKHNFAISAIAETPGNWARAFKTSGGMADKTNKWLMRLAMLDAWHWRLMRVQIDSRDAIEVIRYWDNPDAVFYLDPPYHCAVVSSHTVRRAYKRTTGDEHYRELAETILQCQGAVVLSGYACDALKPLEEHGWERIDFRTACHALAKTRQLGNIGKGSSSKLAPRVESVWRNRRAIELCGSPKAKDR